MRNFAPFFRARIDRAGTLLRTLAIGTGMLLAAGCAPRYAMKTVMTPGEENQRQAIVDYAKSLLGVSDLRSVNKNFKNDCSGLVNGVYAMKGRTIAYAHVRKDRNLSESLSLTLEDNGLSFRDAPPNIADAVFFSNTYQTPYNSITHVGLVEKISEDGTVSILHYASGKVSRISMNLRHPDAHKDEDGKVLNDYVRKDSGSSGRKDYLAGRLFSSYGDVYRYTENQR